MSRKSKVDADVKDDWAIVKMWSSNLGFSPFKPDKEGRTKNAVVILHYSESEHALLDWIDTLFTLYCDDSASYQPRPSVVIVVDISLLVPEADKYQRIMDEEGGSQALDKRVSKPLYRCLSKLLLSNATLVAAGDTAQVLLKLLTRKAESGTGNLFASENVARAILISPRITPAAINAQLSSSSEFTRALHLDVVFPDGDAASRRFPMVLHAFPRAVSHTGAGSASAPAVFANIILKRDLSTPLVPFNDEYVSVSGETLWFGELTVDMSKYTKQYEQKNHDITSTIASMCADARGGGANGSEDGDSDPFASDDVQYGALVLRGNRCVMIRSLDGAWRGMRIPAVMAHHNESPIDAAVRSMTELCDIDDDEFELLPGIPPAVIYRNTTPFEVDSNGIIPRKGRGVEGTVTLFAMYATHPPPEGPLEDADIEDEEDSLYDWYTFPRAVQRLLETGDVASVLALQTMAHALAAAAKYGRVPNVWGGVFGQEFVGYNGATEGANLVKALPLASIDAIEEASDEKFQQSMKSMDISSIIGPVLAGGDVKPVPVTLLSGFLGAGKTTLLQHILTNQQGLKIALIINDMADVNIDAILVHYGAGAVSRQEEKVVEMTNGCICCTLREDLLVEIAQLASTRLYDYLIIESSGIAEPLPVAETFTFTDSNGITLSSIAKLDTLVTVVDGSTFEDEMTSLESLKERGWEAANTDTRSVAELMCEQIEFSNIVILNKCDMLSIDAQDRIELMIHKLNPETSVIRSTLGRIDPSLILNTGRFHLGEAEKNPLWLKEARLGEHKPETEEFGIRSFTFRSTKPFHPTRLHEVINGIESRGGPLGTIVRLKGFAWIATRSEQQTVVAFAGRQFKVTSGAPWWAMIEQSEWPAGLKEAIAPLWHEPYGDRQNEIVVIGRGMDADVVRGLMQGAILTDEEFALGMDAWAALRDPFAPIWEAELAEAEAAGHGHDHDHHHDNDDDDDHHDCNHDHPHHASHPKSGGNHDHSHDHRH